MRRLRRHSCLVDFLCIASMALPPLLQVNLVQDSAMAHIITKGLGDLARSYGWLGAAWRGLLLHMLERDCSDGSLLMDGIFVEPEARGRGVGTALLHAVERHAATMGLKSIRLDVIDTNSRARALYEREGFAPQSALSLGPLKPIFGFSSATQMTKSIGR